MKFNTHLNKLRLTVLAIILIVSASQAQIQTRNISIPSGRTSIDLSSSIKGDQIIDYKIYAATGQVLKVKLKTNNNSSNFNIMAPGSTEEAIFTGSSEGNEFGGTLSVDGEYTIRVYLMRSAARRNETAKFTVSINLTGNVSNLTNDAKVPGTNYHATGKLTAHLNSAPNKVLYADFGVIRKGNGAAALKVNLPGLLSWQLNFSNGEWTCETENCKLTYDRHGADEWKVTINDYETYYIPDAVITGG